MSQQAVMLITGSRKGIGRNLVEYYIEKGYVIYGCSREAADYSYPGYHHYCLDVADEQKVRQMFAELLKSQGRLDILINNAGIASMNHALLTPVATVQKIFSTNVVGSFLFAREAAKVMMKRKTGRIVNFATVATPMKLAGEAIYMLRRKPPSSRSRRYWPASLPIITSRSMPSAPRPCSPI